MHTNKTLALLAALTLGAASAATPLAPAPTTTAGTTISNTASASFTNPATNTTASTQSNTVSTTVLPRAGFDVTYLGGGDSETTGAPAGAPSTYQRAVLPGTTVSFEYVAVNTGNTTQNIALSSQVTGDVSNVRFYAKSADTNNDSALSAEEIAAATAITSVTVAPSGDDTTTSAVETNSGEVNFFMVYTVNAAPSTVVGATPVGTGQEYNSNSNTNVQKAETATDLFLQYSQITVQNSGALIGPRSDADGNGAPQTEPYTDAAGTTITPTASDSQQANVRAGVTSVTFINTVQNSGDAADNFTVTSGTAGTVFLTPTGTQVSSSPTTVSVTPTKGGAAYDVTYTLVNGKLVISGLRPGDTASFQNTVPFKDATPNVSDTQTTTLTVASANNPQRTDTTTNVIRDPGLQFGDKKLGSTVPDASYNPNPAAQPGATVSFPMQIVNSGGATDTFTVAPTTVTFPLVGGGTVTVPVNYAPDTNCDGTPDGTGSALTLAAGAQGCFVATVVIPQNAASGTTSPITQTVTTGTGLTSTDTTNTVNVQVTNSNVALAKFVRGGNGETSYAGVTAPSGYTTSSEALPGAELSYAIIAQNNFNAPVSNFFVCDTVPMNTTFVSVSGGGLYSLDKGATWSSAAPTTLAAGTPTAKGGEVCVAPAGRSLTAGSTFRADFTVRVN